MCNDVELVGKYLDSLESYLLKSVEDQLDGNQINEDIIDEKLAAIFSAESNQNFGLHQKLLEKLEKNKIIAPIAITIPGFEFWLLYITEA